MDDSHDPLQCIKQLRQTLAADKLSLGFLLGAGCPCAIRVPRSNGDGDAPLIPDLAGLTRIVVSEISRSTEYKAPFNTLMAVLNEDKYPDPNVEIILSRIRTLREAAGNAKVRNLSAKELDDLDREVCQVISKTVACDLPGDNTPYHSLARMAGRHPVPPFEIFTTNYDLLTEQAFESLRLPFFDGFIGSSRPYFDQRAIEDDPLPPRWSLLWKLHGSIHWRFNNASRAITRSREQSDGQELLIHPSHRKYDESRRMPYLVMVDRLKGFLRNQKQPVALFVIGHSFSDEHLNETIVESLKANASAACFALQYDNMAKYPMLAALAKAEANLTVLARDVAIIRRREAQWLARPSTDIAAFGGAFELIKTESDTADEPAAPQSPDEDTETPRPCRFHLGDFARFGAFLDDLAGYVTPSETGT
ncbi:MAG: SIR2 family protein [Rhodospirillales bacterium]|nr:MAG: SIR2 family protein [Rhodospirillales bacterium]